MGRFYTLLLSVLFVCTILCSCDYREISRVPVNSKYTSAYNTSDYDYVEYVDPDDGETYTVKYERTVHYSESYEIQYKVTYADKHVDFVWEPVTKEEYEKFNGGTK